MRLWLHLRSVQTHYFIELWFCLLLFLNMEFRCNCALSTLLLLSYPLSYWVFFNELAIVLLHLLQDRIYRWGPLPARFAFLCRWLAFHCLTISCHIRILAHSTHKLSLIFVLLDAMVLILSCRKVFEKKHIGFNDGTLKHVWFIVHCLLERLAALVTKRLLSHL